MRMQPKWCTIPTGHDGDSGAVHLNGSSGALTTGSAITTGQRCAVAAWVRPIHWNGDHWCAPGMSATRLDRDQYWLFGDLQSMRGGGGASVQESDGIGAAIGWH
jgi:hypothetical protein